MRSLAAATRLTSLGLSRVQLIFEEDDPEVSGSWACGGSSCRAGLVELG